MILYQRCSYSPVALEDIKMSYEKVRQASKIVVGTKQTVKALKKGLQLRLSLQRMPIR